MTDTSLVTPLLESWQADPIAAKPAFLALYDWLAGQADVHLELVARPGVSYSLRARHAGQKARPFFAMVDVVDDDPAERWLSVCFFNDMVSDPDELGDFAPGGLFEQDALCLNLDEDNAAMRAYILARLAEAAQKAPQY